MKYLFSLKFEVILSIVKDILGASQHILLIV